MAGPAPMARTRGKPRAADAREAKGDAGPEWPGRRAGQAVTARLGPRGAGRQRRPAAAQDPGDPGDGG
jgi:hypothetical protein